MKNSLLATVASLALALSVNAQTATVSVTDATINGANMRTIGQAASTTNYIPNDGKTLLVVDNRQTSNVTLTLVTQKTSGLTDLGEITLSDVAITIPSTSVSVFGPFDTDRFNLSGGLLRANLTSSSNISLTAVKTPRK